MQLIDPKHSFYRPLAVRLIIVAVCLGWAILELTTGEPFWAILSGALGVYAAWMLLVNYTPVAEVPETPVSRSDETDDSER